MRSPTNARRRQAAPLVASIVMLGLLASGCGENNSSSSSTSSATSGHLAICSGNFALCAAATCTPTGSSITLNDGTTFPSATCTCPVEPGPSIADTAAGNMQGSCNPPPGGIWSLYAAQADIPQAGTTPPWSNAAAPFNLCPAGTKFAQCWNLSCTFGAVVNGVQLATCTCPMETATGSVGTQAGQGSASVCTQIPVAGAVPSTP
ncbi:MAG: hypothetical protein M1336_00735 [Deltaproteobacteria bacterium]|nr:hypothetical protein [Deltaproteobacteria bacterium]